MILCKFCSRECKNENSHKNHERTCPKNLDRKYKSYTVGHSSWNKGLTKETDERVANNALAQKASSKSIGRCTDPVKEELRRSRISKATKGKSGGYRENAGRSKKFKVFDSFGNQTTLQSTYEYAVFELLCELGIRWVRPKALRYNNKNYFADFYLVDFNVYLDPKNDYKATQDSAKIKAVTEQNNVRLYVLLSEQINKHTIGSVIQ